MKDFIRELKDRVNTIEYLADAIYYGEDQEANHSAALALETVIENTKALIAEHEAALN